MPTMKQPAAKTPRCCVTTHKTSPSAAHSAAATMAQRSPKRSVSTEAGRFDSSEPMPINATIRAASDTEPPRSRAVSGRMGRIAPSPTPNSSDGPNAGRAMRRSGFGAVDMGAGGLSGT